MPRSERVTPDDSCGLQRRWSIRADLANKIIELDAVADQQFSAEGLRWPGLFIISGFRSAARQLEINPSVPASKHTRCPAMAVDLRVGDLPASTTSEFWPYLGQIWKRLGGRWGGDFTDYDPNHFEVI